MSKTISKTEFVNSIYTTNDNYIFDSEAIYHWPSPNTNSNYIKIKIPIEETCVSITDEDTPIIENKEINNYNFEDIIFRGVTFKNVRFNNTIFQGVKFLDCTLQNVYFRDCIFRFTSFISSTLKLIDSMRCYISDVSISPDSCLQDSAFYSSLFWDCKLAGKIEGLTEINKCLISHLWFSPQTDATEANVILHLVESNTPDLEIIGEIPSNLRIAADELSHAVHLQCPEEGSFIGWKKTALDTVTKLLIPADALRSSAGSRKCRCSKAKVLSIEYVDGTPYEKDSIHSNFDPEFIYTIGDTINEFDFNKNRWKECSAGIHFFITREEAVAYI